MNSIIKLLVIVGLVMALAYAGLTVWSSVSASRATAGPKLPEVSKAQFIVTVRDTGNTYFTNKYEQVGQVVGSRRFVLHGYWEMVGHDLKLRSQNMTLSEKVFGIIDVRRRQ